LQINTNTLATDLISSSGFLSLGAGLVPLNASDLGNSSLTAGEIFTFISAPGGVSGTFAGLLDGAAITVGSTDFTIDYTPNSVALVAVPEPSAVAMFLGGLGSLLAVRRFRRNFR